MISEIFVAGSDDDAARYLDEGPAGAGLTDAIGAGEVTALELDALQSTLTGVGFRQVLESGGGGLVQGRGENGPWIGRLRPALVEALAATDEPAVRDVVGRWATHDEVEDLDETTLADVLPPLIRLARLALARDDRMYLWNLL